MTTFSMRPSMYRILRLLAIASFFLAPVFAHALIILPPPDRDAGSITIASQDIHAVISGNVARTTLKLVLHNSDMRAMEASLLIPIPKDAQAADFSMMIDGKKVSAEVLGDEEALRLYQDIVRRMRDPGILQYLDEQTFQARLFPIPPDGDMEVEFEFLQPVRRTGGLYMWRYEAPGKGLAVRPGKSSFDVVIEAREKLGMVSSTTHELQINRDAKKATLSVPGGLGNGSVFNLVYTLESADLAMSLVANKLLGEEQGTFLLLVNPPKTGALSESLLKGVVFVLDTSGSMEDDGKFDKAISALRQCLSALNVEDNFNVLTFASGVESFREQMLPATAENVEAAKGWLGGRKPRGGTNIHDALISAAGQLAARPPDASTVQQIIFMTDGLPTVGKTDRVQIIGDFREAAKSSQRVFTLGFGYDVNTHLLDAIADETKALSDYVEPKEDLELVVTSLFEAISTPVLTDLRIDFEGIKVVETYPSQLPDLFAGRDSMILGSYTGDGKASINLSARARGKEYKQTLTAEFPKSTDGDTSYVRAIWAGRKVAYLLDQIRQNGENKELVDEVTRLAREYRLVTPYTSYFVAPDEPQQRRRDLAMPSSPTGNLPNDSITDRYAESEVTFDSGSLSDTSGSKAVGAAKTLRREKDREIAPEGYSESVRSDPGIREVVVRGRVYTRLPDSGSWVRKDVETKGPEVRVKYLSAAYMELLRRFPEYREEILLGESVELQIGGRWVIIGDDGAEEKLPF